MDENIKIAQIELDFIRSLKDFDLTMLLSEINDHGWDRAKLLIPLIQKTIN